MGGGGGFLGRGWLRCGGATGAGGLRVLLTHPGGGLIQGPIHPEFWHTHRPTNAPPPPPGGGSNTHPPTHPRTQLRHAIQKTKFFTEVNNHHVPFAFDTNDGAS